MDIREIVEMMWIPRLEAFKPEMIFISAGFDAHREDDMGQLGLTEQDYTWITQRIKDVARAIPRGASCRAWRAATSWARWRAAWKRMCACWPICDVFPGAQGVAPIALRCPLLRQLR
jgi:hypothetical protein